MEDAIFIKVLEHGEEIGLDGTTNEKFKEWAHDKGYIDIESKEEANILSVSSLMNVFHECFIPAKFTEDTEHRIITKPSHVLKTEYYFRLIEYRELQEARKASRQANNNAWIAIRISFLAIIFSLIVAGIQIYAPTKISKSDLQALIESNTSSVIKQEVKLNKLQMAQILSAIESRQSKSNNQRSKAILPSNETQHHELINKYFEDE